LIAPFFFAPLSTVSGSLERVGHDLIRLKCIVLCHRDEGPRSATEVFVFSIDDLQLPPNIDTT
jgi:hypothetical protein